jgi:hypothetical protein
MMRDIDRRLARSKYNNSKEPGENPLPAETPRKIQKNQLNDSRRKSKEIPLKEVQDIGTSTPPNETKDMATSNSRD